MGNYRMPSLKDYLEKEGWDIISETFFLNEKENIFLRINDGRLYYNINKADTDCVPFIIMMHHLMYVQSLEDYEKIIRLLEILENKDLKPFYERSSYTFVEFPDEYWAFNDFYGLIIFTETKEIRCIDTCVTQNIWGTNDSLFFDYEVIKNILIEIALKTNCDYYYDYKKGKFEITLEQKRIIIEDNRRGW